MTISTFYGIKSSLFFSHSLVALFGLFEWRRLLKSVLLFSHSQKSVGKASFIPSFNISSLIPKLRNMKFLSRLYTTICFCGLIYQIFLICSEFFKYSVSSSINLAQANDYNLPSLSTCFRFEQIFNHDIFNVKHVHDPFILNDTDMAAVYLAGIELSKRVTMNEIHDCTPPANEMVNTCEIRDADTYKFNLFYEPGSCADKIIVEKYVISGLVCYKMTLKSNWSGASISDSKGIGNRYSRESAFFAPSDPGFLMSVFPNKSSFQHLIQSITLCIPQTIIHGSNFH